MAQVAADEFNIPLSRGKIGSILKKLSVTVEETNTSIVANAMCTAASVSSDLNGMAIIDACRQIKERLAPLFEEMPGIFSTYLRQ